MASPTPERMRKSLDRLCDLGEPVALVELAQALLAIDTPMDLGMARRVVGSALGRSPDSLSDPIHAQDLGRNGEYEVAHLVLGEADFVVVDLETTGLSSAYAEIIEIGAVRVSRLQVVDQFETLVRPAGSLSPSIVALTGISDETVADAPSPFLALGAFRDWLDATPLAPFVAHNSAFDHGFVSRGISNRARHRALGDAQATASALVDMLDLAVTGFELRTLGDLFALHRRPPRKRLRSRRR
jgi:hypothetical protein